MLRWLTTLIPTTLLAAVVVVAPSPAGSFGGIQFVTNASLDYDHGLHTGLPNGWGDGEFTLKVVISPDDSAPIGETQSSSGRINNWANETAEPYSDPQWWFLGNFLLDGHNNSVYANGTFSFQIHNSGYMRWLFGDGSGSIPTGGLWQDDSQVNVLDGGRHIVHVTREFTGASDSTLRMYVDWSEPRSRTPERRYTRPTGLAIAGPTTRQSKRDGTGPPRSKQPTVTSSTPITRACSRNWFSTPTTCRLERFLPIRAWSMTVMRTTSTISHSARARARPRRARMGSR